MSRELIFHFLYHCKPFGLSLTSNLRVGFVLSTELYVLSIYNFPMLQNTTPKALRKFPKSQSSQVRRCNPPWYSSTSFLLTRSHLHGEACQNNIIAAFYASQPLPAPFSFDTLKLDCVCCDTTEHEASSHPNVSLPRHSSPYQNMHYPSSHRPQPTGTSQMPTLTRSNRSRLSYTAGRAKARSYLSPHESNNGES